MHVYNLYCLQFTCFAKFILFYIHHIRRNHFAIQYSSADATAAGTDPSIPVPFQAYPQGLLHQSTSHDQAIDQTKIYKKCLDLDLFKFDLFSFAVVSTVIYNYHYTIE